MNSITTAIVANFKRYLVQSICGLAIALSVWQGLTFGFDTALAASAIDKLVVPDAIGNNRAQIASRLAVKENLKNSTAESGKDGSKNPAKSLLETTETGVKIDADKAEKFSGDTPEIVKKTADSNSKQAENFSKNTIKNIKKAIGS